MSIHTIPSNLRAGTPSGPLPLTQAATPVMPSQPFAVGAQPGQLPNTTGGPHGVQVSAHAIVGAPLARVGRFGS